MEFLIRTVYTTSLVANRVILKVLPSRLNTQKPEIIAPAGIKQSLSIYSNQYDINIKPDKRSRD